MSDDKPTTSLCVIATGAYGQFVPALLESARLHFLAEHDVSFLLLSDKEPAEGLVDKWVQVEHEPWPGPTLHRYRWMLRAEDWLSKADYIFYIDADCLFVDTVGTEILGNLTAVAHQGFINHHPDSLPYERRPSSMAFVRWPEGVRYYAGGFQGGASRLYLDAMKTIDGWIEWDTQNAGRVAVWHDESHWNRFLINRPPDVSLPPTYLSCEAERLPGTKLLALDKDHSALRT